MKFHSGIFLYAQMLFSRHLSDPLLLSQNRNCDVFELQYPSMDGGLMLFLGFLNCDLANSVPHTEEC